VPGGGQALQLRSQLTYLYQGHGRGARAFRFAVLAFDLATIVFFIVSSLMRDEPWIYAADALIAIIILADFLAQVVVAENRARHFLRLTTWLDILVIASLLAPTVIESLLFLRVLRALRLVRSYRVLQDLRQEFAFFKRNEDVIASTINLFVFIFVVTALVYVLQVATNPDIKNYIDALYFTVTTLTTTGFGDITLKGPVGRLLSVLIMILGVALFLRLVQTIFRPAKVSYECPDCGLNRHDPDAVHCKHCGRVLHIGTEGD
jgi:voltage-gated potassium channel